MESDAVPDPPRSHPSNSKNKADSKSKTTKSNVPNNKGPSVQNVYRDVYNFTGASNVHIGNVLNFGNLKKKNSSGVTKKKKPEIPSDVSEVMRLCLDVLEFADVAYIKKCINTPWDKLAEKIKTHTDHLENLNSLSPFEAVEEVLLSWIEEHGDSALVAILVGNLWELSEKEAACILAAEHLNKKITC